MSELEDYKAGRESRAGVVSRAGQHHGSTEVVQRLVDAAIYRETHQPEPESTADAEPDE